MKKGGSLQKKLPNFSAHRHTGKGQSSPSVGNFRIISNLVTTVAFIILQHQKGERFQLWDLLAQRFFFWLIVIEDINTSKRWTAPTVGEDEQTNFFFFFTMFDHKPFPLCHRCSHLNNFPLHTFKFIRSRQVKINLNIIFFGSFRKLFSEISGRITEWVN